MSYKIYVSISKKWNLIVTMFYFSQLSFLFLNAQLWSPCRTLRGDSSIWQMGNTQLAFLGG